MLVCESQRTVADGDESRTPASTSRRGQQQPLADAGRLAARLEDVIVPVQVEHRLRLVRQRQRSLRLRPMVTSGRYARP